MSFWSNSPGKPQRMEKWILINSSASHKPICVASKNFQGAIQNDSLLWLWWNWALDSVLHWMGTNEDKTMDRIYIGKLGDCGNRKGHPSFRGWSPAGKLGLLWSSGHWLDMNTSLYLEGCFIFSSGTSYIQILWVEKWWTVIVLGSKWKISIFFFFYNSCVWVCA